jgi:hypothetical protein
VQIKTGSWFAAIPTDHIRIEISRGVPRRFPAGYRRYMKLNPGPWFNSVPTLEYDRLYKSEVLDPLDPERAAHEILALANGQVPVLCCYERLGDTRWCHRALVGEWFKQTLGLTVHEVGCEHLTFDHHPLLPAKLKA